MPVWLAIGGVVIGAIAYNDHSDHSDYSDYSNYSNYSDAYVRQQARREQARNEYENAKRTLVDIKNSQIRKFRDINDLYVENIDINSFDSEVRKKIELDCNSEINSETASIDKQVREIDEALNNITDLMARLGLEYDLSDDSK